AGRGAGAKTDAEGRFVMHLPQDEPYRLGVDRDPRFEPWGGFQGREVFAPGANGIRITLKRAARMTVAVVDAVTGAAVERFEVSAGMHGARLAVHPGGRVEVSAEPGPKQTLLVHAPGYVPAELPVEFDEPGVALQTVRVEPGASLTA